MSNTKLVACYGSLKKGHYNHRALGEDKEFLGTVPVRGVMYSNGSYPKLYKPDGEVGDAGVLSPDKERDHVVEIYRVNDQAFSYIKGMEVGAGYTPEDLETEHGTATIYWMPHERFYAGDTWVEAYTDGRIEE